jgi:hypothetical protein
MNYYNPYLNNNTTMPQNNYSFLQQSQKIVQVNGYNGAEAYKMAPNSSIILMDINEPIIWLKITDGAGYPTITGYTISPLENKTNDIEQRIQALEDKISKIFQQNQTSQTSNQEEVKTTNKSANQINF